MSCFNRLRGHAFLVAMTNFDYLKKEPKCNTFSDVAIAAEKILYIDPTSCIINCRRAMEFAIKWMYSVDASLTMPYQDNLISLMSTEEFRDIIDEDLMKRNRTSVESFVGGDVLENSSIRLRYKVVS